MKVENRNEIDRLVERDLEKPAFGFRMYCRNCLAHRQVNLPSHANSFIKAHEGCLAKNRPICKQEP